MPPPRLTVLAARDADVAVVLRRGPTDWVRLHHWDTADDSVEDGGWLRARVSGRRVDVSPDGRLFVAFVAAHGRTAELRRDTWVAVSRPPWWRALALWFDGTTWSFGGFFPDAASCAGLGPGDPDEGRVPPWFDAAARLPASPTGQAWTDVAVPHNRRVRDGWIEQEPGWWERPLADGGAVVVAERVGASGQVVTETALRRGDDTLMPFAAGTSVDVDRAGRALVGRAGCLEVCSSDGRLTVVADVADQQPQPTPSPAWAARWPGPPPR